MLFSIVIIFYQLIFAVILSNSHATPLNAELETLVSLVNI